MEQLLASQTKLEATLHRHQQELRLFEQIRQALFANSDMNNVFPVVVERIATAFSFPLVSIYLLEYGELRLQAQVGRQEYYGIIPLNQGVCGRVARTAQAVFILDVAADADYLEDLPGVTNLICIPLIGRGREVLGTLMVESFASRPLDEHDFKLCHSLAEHVVLALEQSRLFRSEQRRANQLALLNQIGRDLAATLDVETIIERVIGPIRRKLGYYSVNIGLLENDKLVYRVSLTDNAAFEGIRYIPLETNSLATACVKSGEMLVIPNVSTDSRFSPTVLLPNTRSEVLVPLRAAGQVIGVLDIESDQLNAFDDDDIILLKTLADETSVALENARRFERLERQSLELNQSNRKLAEANRLKSEFLANVSHELRTPLNSIIGYIDMIQSGYYGDLVETMNDPLERVARNGRRLLDLINDVLDLSNIEAGHFKVVFENFILAEMINFTCTKFEQQAQQKGLSFQVEIEPELPKSIQNDPRRLHQILSNLLSNAVKFTEQGEIQVIISPDLNDSAYFLIKVRDSGIGIPEAEFEHIFEEFRQVDGSTTRQYGGTGLGLALASRTCQMIGGTITVSSELGKGSTFTIRLPLIMPPPL
ncbi:MAG: GAF domain-containing protein [Chloroflexi bacterium]|nr:GAF domain-containing protein [Chloroflexota bacterium]